MSDQSASVCVNHTVQGKDGVTLSYFLWRKGQRRRPVIVPIHGLGSNHTRWLELIEDTNILEHWDILAPDLRGFGHSLVRAKINMEVWADDIATMLRDQAYPDAILLGHSLGAHIALFFAQAYPSRVRGMILIDPLSRQGLSPSLRRIWRWRWLLRSIILLIRLANKLGIKRRQLPSRSLRALDIQARDLLAQGKEEEVVRRYGSLKIDLQFNATAIYLQASLEVLRPLPEIQYFAPSLLLLSSGSTYNQAGQQHELIEYLSACTVKYVDCNHWMLTEKPEESYHLIETWLAETFATQRA